MFVDLYCAKCHEHSIHNSTQRGISRTKQDITYSIISTNNLQLTHCWCIYHCDDGDWSASRSWWGRWKLGYSRDFWHYRWFFWYKRRRRQRRRCRWCHQWCADIVLFNERRRWPTSTFCISLGITHTYHSPHYTHCNILTDSYPAGASSSKFNHITPFLHQLHRLNAPVWSHLQARRSIWQTLP